MLLLDVLSLVTLLDILGLGEGSRDTNISRDRLLILIRDRRLCNTSLLQRGRDIVLSLGRLDRGQEDQRQDKAQSGKCDISQKGVLVSVHVDGSSNTLALMVAVEFSRDDGEDGQAKGGTDLKSDVVDGTNDSLVVVRGVAERSDLGREHDHSQTEDVANEGDEGENPVGAVLGDERKHQGRDAQKDESDRNNGLERQPGQETTQDRVENHRRQTVNEVRQRSAHNTVSQNLLECQRRKVKVPLEDGLHDENQPETGREGTVLPDVEGHDRVRDLLLNHKEDRKEDKTDTENRKSLGTGPTGLDTGRDVVDDTDDSSGGSEGAAEVNSGVLAVEAAGLGDGEDAEDEEDDAHDGRDEEDPLPADRRCQCSREQQSCHRSHS